jgi:gluconate 2-dehydrogenase gamma chain
VAPSARLTLTEDEAAFLAAAADTIIPADELSPEASACGVVDFIDRALAGDWGGGARLYRDGPIAKGKPEHGYQLGIAPREFFRAGIAAAGAWLVSVKGRGLAALTEAERQAALSAMENGTAVFGDFDAREFFEALLAIVMEGFFADPIHGGNRDLAGWKMVDYPGQPANYREAITTGRGKRIAIEQRSIDDLS